MNMFQFISKWITKTKQQEQKEFLEDFYSVLEDENQRAIKRAMKVIEETFIKK